jgi:DNA mismatch repair ATPase MutS
MYNLLTDKGLQDRLKKLIAAVYVLDLSAWSRSLVDRKVCVPVTYGRNTLLWNMGHILLDDKQVRNPLSLNKNIIITGPNAAGKTTYVRSLLTNMLLSQSLGIACASKAIVRPVNVIGTFIRVTDTLGKSSLFEAEAQRCAEIIIKAKLAAERGQAGVFFLDEPMHSTPPTEGMNISFVFLKLLKRAGFFCLVSVMGLLSLGAIRPSRIAKRSIILCMSFVIML